MSYYIAIFIEDHIGEWRVVFPDVPGCEARGFTLHDAQYAAASTLSRCLQEKDAAPLLPMDMAALKKSDEWLKKHAVDWSKAVVSIVSLAV